MQNRYSQVKALTFDVFGTVVDWYGSIVAEGEQFGKAHGIDIDWAQFTLKWARRLRSRNEQGATWRIAVAEH